MTILSDPENLYRKDISHTSGAPQPQLSPQILLVLVGLPGSGKTTFSEALVSQSHKISDSRNWVRASQDDAPNRRRQECEAVVRHALQEGHNVVVDRVDFDPIQRSHFITIALSHIPPPKIYCLILSVSRTTLEKRLKYRPDHPTIPDLETGLRVLGQMRSQYKPPIPQEAEGFDRIYELPEVEQPVDGIWTESNLEEVLGKIESDGLREAGERKLSMPSGNGLQNFGRGRGSWSGRGRGDGDWSRGRGGYSSGQSYREGALIARIAIRTTLNAGVEGHTTTHTEEEGIIGTE
uniref:tRNA ligase kinase domain-containing protein n=1 Tax=Kwoniella bestiolae CBS 10118 TaxID=1296100 RepID=A0A1B9FUU0_9TREE|nr:hypothetical protein I302_08190 [Kwoniella bestiolae CBS 10118]OCF22540.1 hypothetical protein I302_08190 [Kwoniella bestiolae CBS 10118]